MFTYLKSLKRPADWSELTEILSKTVFAFMAALIAGAAWLYVQQSEAADKKRAQEDARLAQANERHAAELTALRAETSDKREVINLFINVMPADIAEPKAEVRILALKSYCDEEYRADSRNLLLKAMCQKVGDFGSTYAAKSNEPATQAIQAAQTSGNAADYTRTKAAGAQNIALAASEAAAPVGHSSTWYAVAASVPLQRPEGVQELARSLNRKLPTIGLPADIHIYETKVSGSYAITSGTGKSETDARARVRVLRQSGVVADAFAQPDRGWTLSKLQP